MASKRFVLSVAGIIIFLVCSVSSANVPDKINYQGKLTTSGGGCLNDTVSMTFSIYPDTLGSLADWTEDQDTVIVKQGIFSVILGSVNPIPAWVFDGSTKYLGLQAGSDAEMRPLRPMVSVAYAYRAGTADGGGGAGGWVDDGNVVRLEASTDNVGIGTASPSQKLEVDGNVRITGKVTIGPSNTNTGYHAFIAGAASSVSGDYAVVSGGHWNSANESNSTVGGGAHNRALGLESTVAGGWENTAEGRYSFVGAGAGNRAEAAYSSVLGGCHNTITDTATYSCLFGIYSELTQDSTFMVDMPHIRFGDETNGYEFPPSDGSSGQAMTTDGSGKLSWIDVMSNWLVTGSVLYTNDFWGIARGSVDNVLYGDSAHTMVNLGVACTTGASGGSEYYITVSGGCGNHALQRWSTVSGGEANFAAGYHTTIGGGKNHYAGSTGATISGGTNNYASGFETTVGGGLENQAWGHWSTVGGGEKDTAQATYGGVCSGYSNRAGDDEADTAAVVAGGYDNAALAKYAAVCGGRWNQASGIRSTVGGGTNNTASGGGSTIAGGGSNTADTSDATVGGGWDNEAGGAQSTVSGGKWNTASGTGAAVGGGQRNVNQGSYSVIPGGLNDTLTATADYSMAFGENVYVDSSHRIVFFDGAHSGRLGINRDDHDGIAYPIHVGTNSGNGNGARLTGGGTWMPGSSRAFKEKGQPLDGQQLLAKISVLDIEAWQYKGSDERHIWPYAEDFVEAFDVGVLRENGTRENQYLASGDVAGVALAGVKELIQRNQKLMQIIQELEENNALLEARVAELEKTR